MSDMIFANLPVADLDTSKAFYTALGFVNNPTFTDATAAKRPRHAGCSCRACSEAGRHGGCESCARRGLHVQPFHDRFGWPHLGMVLDGHVGIRR